MLNQNFRNKHGEKLGEYRGEVQVKEYTKGRTPTYPLTLLFTSQIFFFFYK